MVDMNSKPVMLLILFNVVLLLVVFWLIGLIMGKEDNRQVAEAPPAAVSAPADRPPVVAEPPVQPARQPVQPQQAAQPATRPATQPQTAPAGNGQRLDAAIEQAVAQPEAAVAEPKPVVEPELVETVRNINVYYEGGLVRMEESDNHGNRHVLISNSLKEVDKIAPQDSAYVQALRELKQGSRRHVSMTEVTRESAQDVAARKQAGDEAVDRFNKVDVSEERLAEEIARQPTLFDRIDSVVSDAPVKPAVADAEYARASLQDYVRELDTESAERANEMRTIRAKRGDSLWKIAVRAYGNGFDYPRIYKANPHLRNPDMIREGEVLRVPL